MTDATGTTDTANTCVTRSSEQEMSRFGVFPECPHCGGDLTPEHAHFKCTTCGWRDSCCD